MSRACGFTATTTGRPCAQVVEDRHDHCESGHPCPPVKTGSSPGTQKLQASSISLDVDELFLPPAFPATGAAPRRESPQLVRSPVPSPFKGGVALAVIRPGPYGDSGPTAARAQGHTVRIDALLESGSHRLGRILRRSGIGRATKNQSLAFFLTLRDGPSCCYCTSHLTDDNRTIEHVVPQSEGGTSVMENLKLACDWCNHRRSSHTIEAFRATRGFQERYAEVSRGKTIDPEGGGYDHVGPVHRSPSPVRVIYRCAACGASTRNGRRLDAVPCVEVIALPSAPVAAVVPIRWSA